jgi:hypothetical protein
VQITPLSTAKEVAMAAVKKSKKKDKEKKGDKQVFMLFDADVTAEEIMAAFKELITEEKK